MRTCGFSCSYNFRKFRINFITKTLVNLGEFWWFYFLKISQICACACLVNETHCDIKLLCLYCEHLINASPIPHHKSCNCIARPSHHKSLAFRYILSPHSHALIRLMSRSPVSIAAFPSTYFYAYFGILHKKRWMETPRCAYILKMRINSCAHLSRINFFIR